MLYSEAASLKSERVIFQGREMLLSYVKYLLHYLSGIYDTTTKSN